uniref:Uncharacterized protein n=1 Tax=Noccaea caerulescens TaxID=107243 RepID=A0A1J3D2K5_NOCCA
MLKEVDFIFLRFVCRVFQMHGTVLVLFLLQFELNYPDEFITGIQGSSSVVARYNTLHNYCEDAFSRQHRGEHLRFLVR